MKEIRFHQLYTLLRPDNWKYKKMRLDLK